MSQLPWEITPSLRPERLALLAKTIVDVRADARDGHAPEKGDNAWTFGCRAYSRTCFALGGLAASGEYPWLRVEEDGLACTILVDGEPIKFYKGEAKRPTSRSLRRGLEAAVRQGKLSFFEDELRESEGWFWLLAIETHEDGSVMRLAMLQANDKEETRNLYYIATDAPVTIATNVVSTQRDGIDLPPPAVGPKVRPQKVSGDEDGRSTEPS
ncbi:hypothetical protein WMF18_32745 [Sorangium sp. So ce315]|uniref:hypothetical protein n=1 Tax=Sorangium sp. So ce315 TaxID=3133299 RepID=UPI003F615FD8